MAFDAVALQIIRGEWKAPKASDKVALPDGASRQWERITAGADGAFSGRALSGGYMFLTVDAPEAGAMILKAQGHNFAYVNGELRAGDPYQNGTVRVPIMLRKGVNGFLFQVSRGRLAAELVAPIGPVQLGKVDATLPDLVAGQALDAQAGVIVVNTSETQQADLAVSTVLPGGKPCQTELPALPPLSLRKVAVRLQSPAPTAKGRCDVALRLERRINGGWQTIDTDKMSLQILSPESTCRYTFRSQIDGSVQYYAVVPRKQDSTDAAKPALVLTLHGAAVEALGQANSYAPKSWAHIVAPTNRRPYGFDWEDWGRLDAMEVLDLAHKRLDTDARRTYLTGHSMGGHGTWHIGATFPDRFAAIGPSAGWVSMWSYGGARRSKETAAADDIVQRSMNASDTLAVARNYIAQGVYVLHGDRDDNVPVGQARTMKQHLSAFHKDLQYHEESGAGHWWGKANISGAACVDWPPMFEFFRKRALPEAAAVRHVEFRTASPGVSARAHWATIEMQERPMRFSKVDVTYDPASRRLTGTTENVARLAFTTSHLEPGALQVEVDGAKFEDVPWPAEHKRIWLSRMDGKWSLTQKPAAALKGPHRYGPFKEAFRNRMLFVYGTKGTAEENAWAYGKARYDAEVFWYRGNGSVDIVADTAFDAAQTAERNVILYGNADNNAAWKTLLAESPVQVRRGSVAIGERQEKGENLSCLFVRPRPGSDHALVGVVAGSGLAGMRGADRLPYFISGVGYPDCLLLAMPMNETKAVELRAAGFFGEDWSVDRGEMAWRQ